MLASAAYLDVRLVKEHMRKVTLFDRPIIVYDESCCSDSTMRTLYIEVNNVCNASCSFGCSRSTNSPVNYVDISRLYPVLETLIGAECIDKVAITGGEPTLLHNFNELLECLSVFKPNLKHVSFTTNGSTLPKRIGLLDHSCIDYLNVSRHHFDDNVNDTIFGLQTITGTMLSDIMDMSRLPLRLNCTITENLYEKEDVLRYIDHGYCMGASSILFRKNYNGNESFPFPIELKGKKVSNKCQCSFGTVDGMSVEYREVDAMREYDNEKKKDFIRNFVYHTDQCLYGGWSNESLKLTT